MAVKPVRLALVADTAQLRKGLLQAEAQLTGFGNNMKRLGAQVGIGFAAVSVIRNAWEGLLEGQKVAAQTTAAIKSTGAAANVTADGVYELSRALMRKSGIDEDLIQSGANLLLTFTKVRNEVGEGNDIFDRATEAALDLSTAGFGSVTDTSKQLGKALQDPIAGMTALRRAGVTFTDSQKDTIRSLVETGDTLGAQKLILEEVERQVGGSAEAYGETLSGQVGKAKHALGEASEAILATALPALQFLADTTQKVAFWFTELPQPIQAVALALGLLAAARSSDTVMGLVGALRGLPALLDKVAIGAYSAAGGLTAMKAQALGLLALKSLPIVAALAVAADLFFTIRDRADEASGAAERFADSFGSEPQARLDGLNARLREVNGTLDEISKWSFDIPFTDITIWDTNEAADAAAFRDALEEQRVEALLLSGVLPAVEESIGGYSGAAREAADATSEHEAAMKDLNDALRAQFDPLFAVQDALLDNKDAQAEVAKKTAELAKVQEEYNSALASGDQNAIALASLALAEAQREVDDANRDATRSALDAATSMNELTGKVRDGTVSLDDSKQILDDWVTQGLITQDQANQTRDAFALLAWVAGSVPKEVRTDVEVDGINEGIGALLAYEGVLDRINAKRVEAIPLTSFEQGIVNLFERAPSARAEGGPVMAGRPYLVGEEGPELFVSNTSGTIVPNDQLGGAGMSIGTINFNVPASEEVAAHTVRRMRQMSYLLGGA